ncbi:hypothetical protein [Demequina phytophila]|uniref:hypothetical protein n=1 Tax=Demequina phytophila TaxID=1638981 RepID=UPI0007842A3B|nr:hypothetical protein [Demequina phytophila]
MTRDETGLGTPARDDAEMARGVAPSKPAAPRATPAPLAPVPIDLESDADDVASPLPAPPAEEVMPEPRSPFDLAVEAESVAARPSTPTSYELLGAAAARNAALHAAGAPTPLGGVPRVTPAQAPSDRGSGAVDAPAGPTYVPTVPARAAAPADAPSPIPSWVAVAEDGAAPPAEATGPALYRPRMATGETPATAASSASAPDRDGGDGDAPAPPAPPRGGDRAWPLILIGLVILVAVLAGAAWALFRPATVEIPAQQVVDVPAARVVEPIVPEDPTPFLAAMPVTSGMWSLTEVTTPDPAKDAALPERVAEVQVLTYDDGTDQVTLTARQLYTEQDAHDALVRAAGRKAALEDATVGSTVVGERAVSEKDGVTTVRWTNGSAYFEATGPAGGVEGFVETLGL